jgi:dTDP-4-amino-4,6-dideoxygalactose transaminase
MKVPFANLNAQYLSIKTQIDNAIKNVISESAFTRGKYVTEFEKKFALFMGVNHCVSCGNGTDALYILIKGLKIKPGDEVITTAHSWISTSETITQAGGKVIFCDTKKDSFTIDPEKIEDKVTSKTVGIIPVHLYGQAADMDPIMDIAKKNSLWVIEDCAQAHLAEYKGRKVGTFGNAATFSFYPGKNLGAMGDAGCVITNDNELSKWCTLFANHGGKGKHFIEGINSRMDGIQASILSAKLPYLNGWTTKRQEIAKKYDSLLSNIEGLQTPKIFKNRKHVFHLYVLKVSRRNELMKYLNDNGVDTMLNYPKALPFFPAYSYLKHKHEDFPNAYNDSNQIISIPIFPEISDDQILYVASKIKEFYNILNK